MTIIYGRTVGFNGSGGGVIPPRPDETDYTWYRTITSAQNLVINKPGWYRIYVVGNGGNGGPAAGYCSSQYTDSIYHGASGGGGGLGGYAIHEIHLNNEDIVQVTSDASKWQVQIKDEIIYATHGGNGGTGTKVHNTTVSGAAGGIAGTASGGNIMNVEGVAGLGGTSYSRSFTTSVCTSYAGGNGGSSQKEYKYRAISGGKGATGSSSMYCGSAQYRNAAATSGAVDGTNTSLGQPGGGGGGLGGDKYSDNSGDYCSPNPYGGNAQGYTGGVVLEIVED